MTKNFRLSLWGVLILLILSSCSSKDVNNQSIDQGFKTRLISMANLANTRNTSDSKITSESINFYLFSKDSDNKSELLYYCNGKDLSYDDSGNKTVVKIKFPFSIKGEVKLIALINHPLQVNKESIGMTYKDFKEQLTYTVNTKINGTTPPYWGVVNFDIDAKNQENLPLRFFKSFASANLKLGDQSKANYKMESISSVRIYRSINYGYIHTEESYIKDNSITQTNIPSIVPAKGGYIGNDNIISSILEASKSPLTYQLDTPNSEFTNEIFLPENQQNEKSEMGKVVAIVVGVKLTVDDLEHFYRVDFADYGSDESVKYKPIIRGHAYQFNLMGAKDKGALTPEDALKKQINIDITVTDWKDYSIDGEYLSGEYNLELDSSKLEFDFNKGLSKVVPFQSNLDSEQLKELLKTEVKPESDSKTYFNVSVDFTKRELTITTSSINNSSKIHENHLFINLINQSFKIEIKQKPKSAQFKFDRRYNKPNGVYIVNQKLNEKVHYINVRLYAEKNTDIDNLYFEITAKNNDGLYIDYKGKFGKSTSETITNEITGASTKIWYEDFKIPVLGTVEYPKNKILTLETDCIKPSFLTVEIPVALTPKKIVGFFGSNYGIKSIGNFTNIRKSPHFGIKADDVIKSEGLNYVETSSTNIQSVIDSEKPDIIIIGGGYTVSKTSAEALARFSKSRNNYGGYNPTIVMSADPSTLEILRAFDLLSNTSDRNTIINLDDNIDNGFDKSGNQEPYRYDLPMLDNDRITNGAFYQLAAFSIQLDPYTAGAIKKEDLIYSKIKKYCGNLPFGVNADKKKKYDYAHTIFRDLNYPLLYIGDSRFITKHSNWYMQPKISNSGSRTIDPTKKGNVSLYTCNNGLLIANVLDWATHTVEYGNN